MLLKWQITAENHGNLPWDQSRLVVHKAYIHIHTATQCTILIFISKNLVLFGIFFSLITYIDQIFDFDLFLLVLKNRLYE